jgi:hypothetical protein
MGYNDPCATDPDHGPAMVGVNVSPGSAEGEWVCLACFDQTLARYVRLANSLAQLPAHPTEGAVMPTPAITDDQRATSCAKAKYLGLLNIPYVWGGHNQAGIDCSGLTMVSWAEAGVSLPHNAAEQAKLLDGRGELRPMSRGASRDLKPGDILFYQGAGGTSLDEVGHCAQFLEFYQGLLVVSQATQPGAGTEIIRAQKYQPVLFCGYLR